MMAFSLPDGRLMVPMRAEGENGEIGDGMVPVGPGDELYEQWTAYFERSGEEPQPWEGDAPDGP